MAAPSSYLVHLFTAMSKSQALLGPDQFAYDGRFDPSMTNPDQEASVSRRYPRTHRFALCLGRPLVRFLVVVVWFLLALGGLLVISKFISELKSSVDPVEGTLSYDAAQAYSKYFPESPLTGVMLIKSKTDAPLVEFIKNSTCKLPSTDDLCPNLSCINLTSSTVRLDLGCAEDPNVRALGEGCVTKPDVLRWINNTLASLAQKVPSLAPNISNIEHRLPEIARAIPNITSCPVMAAGGGEAATEAWLNFTQRVSDRMVPAFPQCKVQVLSFPTGDLMTLDHIFNLTKITSKVRMRACGCGCVSLSAGETCLSVCSFCSRKPRSMPTTCSSTLQVATMVCDSCNMLTLPLPSRLLRSHLTNPFNAMQSPVKFLELVGHLPSGEVWDLAQSRLVADGGKTSLVAVSVSECDGQDSLNPVGDIAKNVSAKLQDAVDAAGAEATPGRDLLDVRLSTQVLMLAAIRGGINETMDLSTMTLPIALLILAAMVRNLRLVICTVLNLMACLAAAILLMYPIAGMTTVSTVAPSLMIAVALAMSIDYSLFMLSRFQLEADSGRSGHEAVAIMLATSGKIVLVSGVTLLLCFLMMLCLPVNLISSMGISAAVTVFMAVAAALTLLPVMLLSFPTFFSASKCWGLSISGCCCCLCRGCRGTGLYRAAAEGTIYADGGSSRSSANLTGSSSAAASAAAGLATAQQPRSGSGDEDDSDVRRRQSFVEEEHLRKTCWTRCGAGVQRFVWPILIVIVAAAVPVGIFALPHIEHSCGLIPLMPKDANATVTLTKLQDSFGVSSLFPTSLLIVPPGGADLANATKRDAWLTTACEALKDVAHAVGADADLKGPHFGVTAFTGAMISNGTCVTNGGVMGAAAALLGGGGGNSQWSNVGGNYSATKVSIAYPIDPFSSEGQAWIVKLREAFKPHAAAVGTFYLGGEGPIQMDVANKTFGRFPLMIALMMIVVIVLIGLSFRSIVAPLRAVLCLLWMLVITFGIAIFTFQDGMFDFLHWQQLGTRSTGAMNWMSPCVAFSVVVGLGLDYDIFYSERVVEEREKGHSEKQAAIRALAATANTISAAGVIMAIAFLSLLISSTPTLNEISFLLTIGVLIDCFVTTKLIIPGVMSLLGKANFWPHKFPAIEPAAGGAGADWPMAQHA